jgi:hypothetical protein
VATEVKRYRKKPVEVCAVFWAEGAAFPTEFLCDDEIAEQHRLDGAVLVKRKGIPRVVADPGRYLVRRLADGVLTAWESSTFEATYEPANKQELE